MGSVGFIHFAVRLNYIGFGRVGSYSRITADGGRGSQRDDDRVGHIVVIIFSQLKVAWNIKVKH